MKICRRCDEGKAISEFHRRSAAADGLQSYCKECARRATQTWRKTSATRPIVPMGAEERARRTNAQRSRRFGFTVTADHVAELSHRQGGRVCGICGIPEAELGFALCVDHSHGTGTLRGLLCNTCNRAIGLLGDTADGVRRALTYLERSAT